ncbi:high light inducible protein [Desertifilum sp. FACHB-1129]|uniref:High light inducible protein n=2 Tax=Desertifilum tharense IPPAS B-1220 TaxID=1781255 RepID=A0A1E5QGE5_9CYAN|nr:MULTISPECIES: chlorophyll a/b-binding protein [Desertifilum]MDA0210002.1 chlorophyll a/b-binding protein [Cyanobacteria bacterium FC1]MBD2313731.1 high light inducible protein [Desertifilum sp. FACHB-1129]MBD2324559.1 high light inducible protein [Desertifilum sp. FACHB-866]MBD2334573.1 high light inducible protein [Desertifilum sp. FACHB-868]OEJ73654.1 high light inducible protein [Desertifilum tharense IPPAS B-1220]
MDETRSTAPLNDPAERNAWKFGFTPQAEIWNGRFAMIGFTVALILEILSGQGIVDLSSLF